MCKFDKKNGMRRIDPCMVHVLQFLSGRLASGDEKIIACCCGHKKYPLTILVKDKNMEYPIEMFSNRIIKRKKRFYKRDKQGYYFIPETLEEK